MATSTKTTYKNTTTTVSVGVTNVRGTFMTSTNTLRIYWNKINTDKYKFCDGYKVQIKYSTVYNNTLYDASDITEYHSSGSTTRYVDYSPADNANIVYFRVIPTIKDSVDWNTKANKDLQKWTPKWSHSGTSSATVRTSWPQTQVVKSLKPATPSAPNLEIEKDGQITVSVDYNEKVAGITVTAIEFKIQNADNNKFVYTYSGDGGSSVRGTACAKIKAQRASFTFKPVAGYKYRACCRAVGYRTNVGTDDVVYSASSPYSGESAEAKPGGTNDLSVEALTSTSVRCTYSEAKGATSYEIEYTTDKSYFDTTSVSSATSTTTTATITGLETGHEYFFRVRAVNDTGNSAWSNIASIVMGRAPAAPTTWSNETTGKVGDILKLYWVHNSQDNSSQVRAELMIYKNGSLIINTTVENSTDEFEKDKTSMFQLNTAGFNDSDKIEWKVRTCGVTGEYGEWSVVRTIELFEEPTLSLVYSNTKQWFWDTFNFTTDTIYTASGTMGSSFDELTKYPIFIQGYTTPVTQTPISYTLKIIALNSYTYVDLSGEEQYILQNQEIYSKTYDISTQLSVVITPSDVIFANGISYRVEAEVAMNSGLTASDSFTFRVNFDEPEFKPSLDIAYNEEAYTTYLLPYVEKDDGTLDDSIILSVHRINYDNTLTALSDDLMNTKLVTITDLYPSLGTTRYRVVAKSTVTGLMSYEDFSIEDAFDPAIIIQWNQHAENFYARNQSDLISRQNDTFTDGKTLILPYNIDVSESNDRDVSLVKYVGRSNPVAYYGTQLGIAGSWSTDVPKDDAETIRMLRQLAIYQGDVYVREPSGIGYWAQIDVSFSTKHLEMVVPVSLTVNKVEGE